MKKRILSAILSLVLLAAMVPPASAVQEEQDDVPQPVEVQEERLPSPPESVTEPGALGSRDGAPPLTGELTYRPYPEATYELTYAKNDNGTLTITGYSGKASGQLVFPDFINGVSVSIIGYAAFAYARGFTGDLVIPDTVQIIGARAFEECCNISGKIVIGKNVKTILEHAFVLCGGSEFIVNSQNRFFKSQNGLLYTADMKKLLKCPGAKTGEVLIADGVLQIDDHAFNQCKHLSGSLVIPDSVLEIGRMAFYHCSFSGNLTIGNRVQIIHSRAFEECGFVGNLVIPDSVTSIGDWAFVGCTGFSGKLTLGNHIEHIYSGAFMNCYGFRGKLVLPSSLKTIEERAFRKCAGFSGDLNIPNGVTKIGYGAFDYCTGFSGNLIIPSSVNLIFGRAFDNCFFSNVYFHGNAPDRIEDGYSNIHTFDKDLVTLHYVQGRLGWTDSPSYDAKSGKWKEYTLQPWAGYVISVPIPEGQHGLRLITSNGQPIPNATVTWNNTSNVTNESGITYFPKVTAGEPTIRVEKQGYLTWTNANSNWTKSESGYETIILYRNDEGTGKLAFARYSNSADMKHSTDLLTKTKKIALSEKGDWIGDLDFGKFYLSCQAIAPDQAAEYVLQQGNREIARSANGQMDLQVKSFHINEPCLIRVVGKDGKTVDTPINLKFVKGSAVKSTTVQLLNDKFSFNVSDDVPFVGGMKFKVSLPIQCPVQFLGTEDGKIRIGFNTNLTGGKEERERINDLIKTVSSLQKQKNNLTRHQKNQLASFVKSKNQMTFFKNGRVDFLGYGEADLGESVVHGQIAVVFSVDALDYGYNTLVWIIPVTVQVKFSLEGGASGDIQYNWEDATFMGGVDASIAPKLEAFGGIGTHKVTGVGAYGSAKLAGDIRIIGTNRGVKSVDLTGQLGVKAYLGNLELKKPFAHHTWNLYTTNSVKLAGTGDGSVYYADLYDTQQYAPMDLTYLEAQSPWMGAGTSLFSSSAQMQLQTLQQHVFRNARPVMVSRQDGLYAAFLRAEPTTGVIEVMLTKFDGTNWCEPVSVHADALLDGSPALFVDDRGVIYLSFTETTPGYDNTSLLDYAKHQKIIVGQVDPQTLTFTKEKTYDGGFLQQPQFVSCNGTAALVWVDAAVNTEDDVLFAPSSMICYAENRTGWAEATTLCSVDCPLLSMTPGAPNGILTAACVLDQDSNAGTVEDHGIVALTKNGQQVLAQGCDGVVTYAPWPETQESIFIWNNGDRLCTSNGWEIAVPGFTGEYRLLDNRLYYSSPKEDTANLTMMPYENGAWSAPVQLTGDQRYLENLNMAEWQGQDYVLGMSTTVTISENTVDDDKNLVFGTILPVSDLVLDDIAYDADMLTAGSMVPVKLFVYNSGDHTVNSVDISVDGGFKETLACAIQPGELAELVTHISCPVDAATYQLSVAETSQEDYTIENNRKALTLGTADVSVTAEYEQIGSRNTIVAQVTNHGISTAAGMLSFYDQNGSLLAEVRYEGLERGASQLVIWDVNEDRLQYQAANITVKAKESNEESRLFDNSTVVNIPKRPVSAKISSAKWSGNQLTVQLSKAYPQISALCVFYNEQGKQLHLDIQPADKAQLTFSTIIADHAKVYLVDSNFTPVCKAVDVSAPRKISHG